MNHTGVHRVREIMQTSPSVAQIRPANPADAPALAQLRFEFRAPLAAATESADAFIERCANWMRPRLIDGSPWRVWLAETSGDLVGAVWMQLVEKLPNPGDEPEQHAYVSNLYVRAGHRNLGAGSALLHAALDECKRRDVDAVFLWPAARSRPLYERFGFTHDGAVLSLER
jgi:GNAT superfamily N-acetyltransferase